MRAIATTSSRTLWAVSRDGALPFSQHWAYVHPYFKMPANAMLLSATFITVSFTLKSKASQIPQDHTNFRFFLTDLWPHLPWIKHCVLSDGERQYLLPANFLRDTTGHITIPRKRQGSA